MSSIPAIIGAAAGGIGSIFGARSQNRSMRNQVKQINRNLMLGAANLQHAAAGAGVDVQQAVNFASNFLRKHGNNPAGVEAAANMAQTRISDATNRATQLKAGAQEMLSKRLAKPPKLGFSDYLNSFISGAAGGLSLGSSLLPPKTTE